MIALVTGANKGIGLEVVRQLAKEGATVYLGSRDVSKGRKAHEKIGGLKNVHVIQLDVTDIKSIERAVTSIKADQGRIDILVNNAGINYDTWHNALNADLENVRETLETNLFGAWAMIQAVLPIMQESAFGRIVNVSSGAGAISGMSSGTPGYSISKAALNILTIQCAQLINQSDLLINAVCPGWVRTDMGGSMASRSVSKGAETIIWATQLPEKGPSGKFFRDKREIAF